MPLSNDNPGVDILGNTPVLNHLDNWGVWAWIGMIILTIFAFALSTFVSSLARRDADSGLAVVASLLTFAYAMWPLYMVLRHLPPDWAGWVVVLGSIVVALWWFIRARDVHPLSYICAALAPGLALGADRLARRFADIPIGWETASTILVVAGLVGFFMWIKDR